MIFVAKVAFVIISVALGIYLYDSTIYEQLNDKLKDSEKNDKDHYGSKTNQ